MPRTGSEQSEGIARRHVRGDAGAHENSVGKIFPRLGETGTVEEIAALLEQR